MAEACLDARDSTREHTSESMGGEACRLGAQISSLMPGQALCMREAMRGTFRRKNSSTSLAKKVCMHCRCM